MMEAWTTMEAWTRAEFLQLTNIAGTIIVALLGYLSVLWGKRNHLTMNSRMDEMLKLRGEASKAEGVSQERARKKETSRRNV